MRERERGKEHHSAVVGVRIGISIRVGVIASSSELLQIRGAGAEGNSLPLSPVLL